MQACVWWAGPGGYRQGKRSCRSYQIQQDHEVSDQVLNRRSNRSLENSWEEATGLQEEMKMGKRTDHSFFFSPFLATSHGMQDPSSLFRN